MRGAAAWAAEIAARAGTDPPDLEGAVTEPERVAAVGRWAETLSMPAQAVSLSAISDPGKDDRRKQHARSR